MIEQTQEDSGFAAFMSAFKPVLEQAYKQGFLNGYAAGETMGYIKAINDMAPAVSDGLRHGSSECGRAMRAIRNIR